MWVVRACVWCGCARARGVGGACGPVFVCGVCVCAVYVRMRVRAFVECVCVRVRACGVCVRVWCACVCGVCARVCVA